MTNNFSMAIALALCMSLAMESATADDCIYQPTKESVPVGTKSKVKLEYSTSYLLKSGAYVSVVNWDCRRIGKRIFIFIPSGQKLTINAFEVFKSVAGIEISSHFKKSFDASSEQQDFKDKVEIEGMEISEFSHTDNLYEQIYTITYATPD